MPILLLRHLMVFSSNTVITPDSIEYGFDTDYMYHKYEMNVVSAKRKAPLMKEIKTKFSDSSDVDILPWHCCSTAPCW